MNRYININVQRTISNVSLKLKREKRERDLAVFIIEVATNP